jgi:hypothetical protein
MAEFLSVVITLLTLTGYGCNSSPTSKQISFASNPLAMKKQLLNAIPVGLSLEKAQAVLVASGFRRSDDRFAPEEKTPNGGLQAAPPPPPLPAHTRLYVLDGPPEGFVVQTYYVTIKEKAGTVERIDVRTSLTGPWFWTLDPKRRRATIRSAVSATTGAAIVFIFQAMGRARSAIEQHAGREKGTRLESGMSRGQNELFKSFWTVFWSELTAHSGSAGAPHSHLASQSSDSDDDSDDDDANGHNRKLTKAERKRLRQQKSEERGCRGMTG